MSKHHPELQHNTLEGQGPPVVGQKQSTSGRCGGKGLDLPTPQRWLEVHEQLVGCSDKPDQGDVKQLRRHKPMGSVPSRIREETRGGGFLSRQWCGQGEYLWTDLG